MLHIKSNKRGKLKAALLLGFYTLLVVPSLAAELYFALPKGTNNEVQSNFIEQNSYQKIDIIFKNPLASQIRINGITLKLKYEKSQIVNQSLSVDAKLSTIGGNDGIIENENGFSYITINRSAPSDTQHNILVDGGGTVTIATFFIKVSGNSGSLSLNWDGDQKVSARTTAEPRETHDNLVTSINGFPQTVSLDPAFAPSFAGGGNAIDATTGRKLTVNFSANASEPNTGALAKTPFNSNVYKYALWEREGTSPFLSSPTISDASSSTSRTVRDGVVYSYRIRARDDCNPVNEEQNTTEFTGISHDLEPPTAPSVSISDVGDGSFTVNWSGGGSDVGGYILFKKDGEASDSPPTFTNAANVNRGAAGFYGTPPTDIIPKTPSELNGWSVVDAQVKTAGSKPYSGLTNGTKYNFKAIAYDPYDDNNQGFNWSPYSTIATGVPGVAPTKVSDFSALSNFPSGITFRWKTSAPPTYTGAKIVYTTDFDQWNNLDFASAEAVDYLLNPAGSTTIITQEVSWGPLDIDKIYYFKAFAHNSSNLPSAPEMASAIPGGVRAELTISLTRTATMGVNTIGLPFDASFEVRAMGNTLIKKVSTLSDLVDAINLAAGKAIVTAVAYWDAATQKNEGATYGGTPYAATYRSSEFKSDIALQAGKSYQVAVTEPVSFKILKK